MKIKRPTTISQVLEYDQAVSQSLLQMLKKRLQEQGMEMSFTKAKRSKTSPEPEDLQDFPYTIESKEEQMKKYKALLLEGKTPSIIDLPPIILPDSASGVPFLEVRVVSWLSNTPQTLPHALLSYTKQNGYKTKN